MKKLFIGAALITGAFALSACGKRLHLGDGFAKANRLAYIQQRVWPTAHTGNPMGLDSEEAAVIENTYRSDLAGGEGGETSKNNQVLILEQPNSKSSKK